MKSFTMCITRYGYADIMAENEDEAFEIIKSMDESEFDWEYVNEDVLEEATIVRTEELND